MIIWFGFFCFEGKVLRVESEKIDNWLYVTIKLVFLMINFREEKRYKKKKNKINLFCNKLYKNFTILQNSKYVKKILIP